MKIISKHCLASPLRHRQHFYWISNFSWCEQERKKNSKTNHKKMFSSESLKRIKKLCTERKNFTFRAQAKGKSAIYFYVCRHKSIMPIHYTHWSLRPTTKSMLFKPKSLRHLVNKEQLSTNRFSFHQKRKTLEENNRNNLMALNFLIIKPKRHFEYVYAV